MSALPDPAPAPVISVVVVNWNGGDEVMTCLRSLAEYPPSAPWDVIVVNNASSDGSVERIRRELPWVPVIANRKNLGLAAGNNQGIRASESEFVLVSNPDVHYQAGAIDRLHDLLVRRERAAFAVARLRDPDGTLQTSAGDLPTLGEALLGRALTRGNGARRGFWWHGWDHDVEQRIGHGGEACYLVRRDTIAEIGLQDERFWLDWEGIDWSRRVAEAGWEIWYSPEAEVVHVGGVSLRQVKYRWIFFSHRGMYRYFRPRWPRAGRPVLASVIALRAATKMAVAAFDTRIYDRGALRAGMRVTFDARNVGLPGIGRFITGLWSGLTELDADVLGIWPGRDGLNWLGAHHAEPAGDHVVMRARPFLPVEQATMPWVLRQAHADVHHATHFNLPYVTGVPIVLTVHDLIAYLDPSKARSRTAGAYYRAALPRAVRRADVIVAVSRFTARQLTETFGVSGSRLHVIEAGIDHDHWWPRDADEIASVRRRFGLPDDYVLYVGTAKPHKNLATLFAAHRPSHLPLVLAGPSVEEVAALGLPPAADGRRIVLGRVPDDALPAIYSGARLLVLPSLHEGFGLTPLEAMACDTPVVVSDGGALPDTVGDAAIVLPASDIGAWAETLTRACDDEVLRARLVRAGRARVGGLRWSDAAARYLDVYRSVAA